MAELDEIEFRGFKSGYVALVGKPNVGKSTLLNHYIGQKIAAVSYKPQTTRRRQLGILTTDEAQIIFIDTPGFHAENYKLSQFINEEAQYALMDADIILFIADGQKLPDDEDRKVVTAIKKYAGDAVKLLVLNKADLVESSKADQIKEAYCNLIDSDDSIWISAITQEGREALLQRITELLLEGPQYYPREQVTTTQEREIAGDLIRAAALHYLLDEVPYGIFVRVNDYELRQGEMRYIHATIFIERESHKGIVIGRGGSMIKKISTLARQHIEEMSGEKVFLELQVKVEKNWRNNHGFLHRFGLSHD